MQSLNKLQINTKVYWNGIYTNPKRYEEHLKPSSRFDTVMKYIKDGDKVLDLGCGLAMLGKKIEKERKNCTVWGIDISDEVIRKDSEELPNQTYKQGYIGSLGSYPLKYFDVVFSGETLEHLDYPIDLFTDAYSALRQGGQFILTTPLENRVDSSEHLWSFAKDDIRGLYEEAGFRHVLFEDLPDMEHLMIIFARGIK